MERVKCLVEPGFADNKYGAPTSLVRPTVCVTRCELVADHAATQARHYLESDAALGEHLADQLVLPMALAGGGSFTVVTASSHLQTNIGVIEKFLPVEIACAPLSDGSARVTVR